MLNGRKSITKWQVSLSWRLIVLAYVGLSMASWGILSDDADLRSANGRHLMAGALSNLALFIMGITVTMTAYRHGERWAWLANGIPLLYGLPIIAIDSYYVGFWTNTVLPQALGAGTLIIGLLLQGNYYYRDRANSK